MILLEKTGKPNNTKEFVITLKLCRKRFKFLLKNNTASLQGKTGTEKIENHQQDVTEISTVQQERKQELRVQMYINTTQDCSTRDLNAIVGPAWT